MSRYLACLLFVSLGCGLAPRSALALPPVSLIGSSALGPARGGAGVHGDLSARWQLSPYWSLVTTGRAGGVVGHSAQPELLLGLLIGPGFGLPVGRSLMRMSLQVAHIHHTGADAWRARPTANLAGDSSGSVLHRSGLEASVGWTWPSLHEFSAWSLVLETDVAGGVLPASEALAWSAGLRLGLGLVPRSGR